MVIFAGCSQGPRHCRAIYFADDFPATRSTQVFVRCARRRSSFSGSPSMNGASHSAGASGINTVVINTAQEAAHRSLQHYTVTYGAAPLYSEHCGASSFEGLQGGVCTHSVACRIQFITHIVWLPTPWFFRNAYPKCATYLRSSIRSRRPISATTRNMASSSFKL